MSIAAFCDVMALLRKAPRTVLELVAVTNLARGTVESYVEALRSEGHVRAIGQRPNGRARASTEYAWQETLYAKPDTPQRQNAREFETTGPGAL